MNNTISMLGCGWLGLPLAKALIYKNYTIKGSTTSPDKLNILSGLSIDPYLVHLKNERTLIDPLFLASDILIVDFPPGLKREPQADYLQMINGLIQCVISSSINKIIFISSTSVYAENGVNVIKTDGIDVTSPLYQAERLLVDRPEFETTIIRFAGLIGPGRHPSRFFSGRHSIPNGQAPVNLIHLDDCIGIIEAVIDQQKFGATYHAASPSHPSRQLFYREAASKAGLPLPVFIDELKEWKTIDPEKMIKELGYHFKYPNLLKCLNHSW